MKLLRLKLENFRQHRDSDIRFAEGMTAIVGANGTGKTTLLEAITFALYGVQRQTKDSLLFFWAEQRSRMRVQLEFQFEGRSYRLERTLANASLIDVTAEPAIVKATGLKEVKATCERLLRLTYEQFKNSFCAEQKSLAFLQFNTDARRQEQVAKMLGFDRLKLAADLARDRGRRFRSEAEGIAQTIGDPVQLRGDLQAAKDELAATAEAKKLAAELSKTLADQLKPSEERRKQAEEYNRLTAEGRVFKGQEEAIETMRKRAEVALAKAEADAKRLRELLPSHEECVALESAVTKMLELREIELERTRIAAELARIEEEIRAFDMRLAELAGDDLESARKAARDAEAAQTAAMNALRAAESAWGKAQREAQGIRATAQSELKQANAALVKARDLAAKGICPECGQPTTATFEERLNDLTLAATKAEEAARE